MSTPGLNPLSFNAWVQTIGSMAVATVAESSGVYAFIDAPLQTVLPQILSYAEGRIQRDLDLQTSQTSNLYTLTAGSAVLSIPINDFLTVQTVECCQVTGTVPNQVVVNSKPLTPTSKEFIQNCYSSLMNASEPKFFSMYGDNFGDGADTYNNILFGPPPNYAYTIRVTGTIRTASLFQYSVNGVADTSYTYISAYYPDMLVMASMIFISAFQRNFSATSDSPDMGQSYEKQYQALLPGSVKEENRKKLQGSGWTSYSTPPAATPNR